MYLFKGYDSKFKDTIPLSRAVSGLKKMDIREYWFRDREKAREEFRRLAFAPNVVMREDSSWLHEDKGSFTIGEHLSQEMADKYLADIKKQFPDTAFDIWFNGMAGRIEVLAVNKVTAYIDKAFYDKFKAYPVSEFHRPRRFSFVIYKKMED